MFLFVLVINLKHEVYKRKKIYRDAWLREILTSNKKNNLI